MAALRCPCPQGSKIWGELWWTGGKDRWVFFDDEKTTGRGRRPAPSGGSAASAPEAEDARAQAVANYTNHEI
jgi:hypothetical protein